MAEEIKKEIPKPKGKKAVETTYTISELVSASEQLFKVRRECVRAALKPLKEKKITLKEATAAVEKFMKQEVK